jgi:hypothetical protein
MEKKCTSSGVYARSLGPDCNVEIGLPTDVCRLCFFIHSLQETYAKQASILFFQTFENPLFTVTLIIKLEQHR